MTTKTILAIDPGFERLGIAILERSIDGKHIIIYSECFKTSAKISFAERLVLIGEKVESIIKKHKPSALSIEKLYLANNQKTVMNVSEARGVVLYVAKKYKLNIFEYSPPQIKVAVTGYGKADKGMVMDMVRKLVKIDIKVKSDDELDAIAIGLTMLACER
ncbi:crossover junction endodeoxyribonuclease RuvC [Candidatus Nomurabacteria bacterium]|nr:crossover junction endodeoxyribonuclease RuvC [Candidatus Nomurabacteria bacterium]